MTKEQLQLKLFHLHKSACMLKSTFSNYLKDIEEAADPEISIDSYNITWFQHHIDCVMEQTWNMLGKACDYEINQ